MIKPFAVLIVISLSAYMLARLQDPQQHRLVLACSCLVLAALTVS